MLHTRRDTGIPVPTAPRATLHMLRVSIAKLISRIAEFLIPRCSFPAPAWQSQGLLIVGSLLWVPCGMGNGVGDG